MHGDWRVEHNRLRQRLAGCTEWDRSEGVAACRPVLDGVGNVDEITVPAIDAIGMTLRLFDPRTDLWSLHWASTTAPRLDPPLTGRFIDGVGTFHGTDVHEGIPIRVRFVWDEITPTTARWTQAFSSDDGATLGAQLDHALPSQPLRRHAWFVIRLGSVVLGAEDVNRAVSFWSAVLGYQPVRFPDADDEFTILVPPSGEGTRVALHRSDTGPEAHPRVHLDLVVDNAAEQATEVERLVGLGATRVPWDSYPVDPDFVVLADPEGNRFCVVDAGHGGSA